MSDPPIPVSTRMRIVEALLDTRVMRDRATRDLVTSTTEEQLGSEIDARRMDTDRADVYNIVDACARQPGALHQLFMAVQFFEGRTFAGRQLQQLMEEVDPESALVGDERAELARLLAGIECPEAEHIYWLAVGPLGPPPRRGRGLADLVDDVEDAATLPDGVPTLMVFLELLAYRTPTQTRALRDWTEGYAVRAGVTTRQVAELRASIPDRMANRPQQSCLVLQLEPYGPAPDQYLLSAWFQRGLSSKQLRRDDEPVPLERVPQELDALLTRHPEVTHDQAPLTVEVVLPRRLMDRDVDQWLVTPGGFGRPVGTEHPVVIRAFERMHDPSLHREWRRKWDWVKAYGGDLDAMETAVHWIRQPGQVDPGQLMIKLKTDATPVCVGLAFGPASPRTAAPDEFTAAILAGAPVMVWCRDARLAEDFETEVRGLLAYEGLHGLRRFVHLYRQRAYHPEETERHLGRHLTLLWDDADRTLADTRLLAPSKEV